MKEYCNPLNVDYKYQHYHKFAHRETADPTAVYFKGMHYIFSSMTGGFYYSDNLIDWKYRAADIPVYGYAPDVCVLGEYLIFSASSINGEKSAFLRTKDPLNEPFEQVSVSEFDFVDPALFKDDDGRMYFYWGCACGKPIYGVEVDNETFLPVGEVQNLIFSDFKNHGWERREYPGRPQQPLTPELKNVFKEMEEKGLDRQEPHIEGAYMNKINGKYYLQYAAPATELGTYGNGVYVSDSPLGPFKYQSHNPFSLKPGGFINGAGHGSTFEDMHRNLYHISTMCISNNAMFERRLGIFPAGVDEDGILYCNQNYADWPIEIPDGKFDCRSFKPQYMLLSYKKKATASSCVERHGPEMALDEDVKTSWCAKESKGEWYMLDLGDVYDVHSLQINFQDVDVPLKNFNDEEQEIFKKYGRYLETDKMYTRYILEGSLDEREWFVLSDKSEADTDLSHDYLVFDDVKVRYIKITAVLLPYNKRFALSGLRVFGKKTGNAPSAVENAEIKRIDATTVHLSWDKAKDAIGYNIRYGISPDKLYLSYMVYEKTETFLTTLNSNTPYYYCIDSFGEGGICEGKVNKLT